MWAISRETVVLPLSPVTATTGIRPVFALGEEHVDDRLADRPAVAGRGFEVHPEPRPGVDLDHGGAGLFERAVDVLGDEVDARDVQADHPGRVHRPRGDVGVDAVGDVLGGPAGAQVGVPADQDLRPGGRDRIGRVPLLGQDGQGDRVVESDLASGRRHGPRPAGGRD